MSMTKQDYTRLARALYASRPLKVVAPEDSARISAAKRAHHRIVVSHIMRELAADNPNFKENIFLKAVYPIPEET